MGRRELAYHGGTLTPVVEEILTQDRQWKVEIWERADGNFQVHLLRWFDEVVPGQGRIASFWSEVRTAASITDTIERARTISIELLRTHAGHDSVTETIKP